MEMEKLDVDGNGGGVWIENSVEPGRRWNNVEVGVDLTLWKQEVDGTMWRQEVDGTV